MNTPVRRVHVLVPFWGLAGGVIKILDYANHAATHGKPTVLWGPPLPADNDLVYTLPVMSTLQSNTLVSFADHDDLEIPDGDLVLFTDPTDHDRVERATSRSLGPRLVHLIQGTRHANPRWQDGRNFRLLHLPMTRIAVSPEVATAIQPYAEATHPIHTIDEGHDSVYFAGRPVAATPVTDHPLRVLYMTWKSDLGDRVATALADDDRFRFIAIRSPVGWPTLRNRYHGADVFLAAPGPEEGFYLPGLEAMAAGLPVVTSLVGGNASYVESDVNALVVPYNDVAGHINALDSLALDAEHRQRLIAAGRSTAKTRTLAAEGKSFAQLLDALDR